MANADQIVNFALARLGAERIFSLDDTDSENARLSKIHYDQTVKQVLRSHPWNCCTERATLARETDAPPFGYLYSFQLPGDFLRALYVNDANAYGPRDSWKIEKNKLLSDDTAIQLVYIYWETNAEQYDELLVEAITVLLASKLAAPITGRAGDGVGLLQEYNQMAFPKARVVDAQEDSSNENHPLQKLVSQSQIVRARSVHSY